MIVTKGDLITGAYSRMRISGVTSPPTPEDFQLALEVCDDYAAQLKADGIDINWQEPSEYGGSDPADASGVSIGNAGPFKKLLAFELLSHFGQELTQVQLLQQRQAKHTLAHSNVFVPPAQNPSTLPVGSGNEFDYRDNKFYQEPPANNGAIYVYLNDIQIFNPDFSGWLVDSDLDTVVYDVDQRLVNLSNETTDGQEASVQLEFIGVGGFTLCATATKVGSTEKTTIQQNFIVRECAEKSYGVV